MYFLNQLYCTNSQQTVLCYVLVGFHNLLYLKEIIQFRVSLWLKLCHKYAGWHGISDLMPLKRILLSTLPNFLLYVFSDLMLLTYSWNRHFTFYLPTYRAPRQGKIPTYTAPRHVLYLQLTSHLSLGWARVHCLKMDFSRVAQISASG